MKKIFFTSTLLLVLFSCNENRSENKPLVENAVENNQSSFSVKRLNYSEDILNAIYSEQIKNNEELKKLDTKISNLQEDSRKMKDLYREIINNSDDYYTLSINGAKSIRDSVLKKEILNLVNNSSESFDKKKKRIKDLTTQINLNYYKIFSFYTAFKIRKTLPEIEKYQNAHPLKTDSLDNFISKQNQLLSKLKNLK
ncbi:hypothetical protein [Chryseobacterium mucoviscidosis]|uniref:hypothetical protein n=1 Tax=Chryseobacterium mucoviscidosis TaxID=1945581 RepID=UPI0031CFA916